MIKTTMNLIDDLYKVIESDFLKNDDGNKKCKHEHVSKGVCLVCGKKIK